MCVPHLSAFIAYNYVCTLGFVSDVVLGYTVHANMCCVYKESVRYIYEYVSCQSPLRGTYIKHLDGDRQSDHFAYTRRIRINTSGGDAFSRVFSERFGSAPIKIYVIGILSDMQR